MRYAIPIAMIVLFSPLLGVVSGDYEYPERDNFESPPIMESYSIPVQLAFDRAEDLSYYSQEELLNANEWLIVTGIPLGEHTKSSSSPMSSVETKVLPGSYIWQMADGGEAVEALSKAIETGEIESFSPLIKKEYAKKFYPNDPEFPKRAEYLEALDKIKEIYREKKELDALID